MAELTDSSQRLITRPQQTEALPFQFGERPSSLRVHQRQAFKTRDLPAISEAIGTGPKAFPNSASHEGALANLQTTARTTSAAASSEAGDAQQISLEPATTRKVSLDCLKIDLTDFPIEDHDVHSGTKPVSATLAQSPEHGLNLSVPATKTIDQSSPIDMKTNQNRLECANEFTSVMPSPIVVKGIETTSRISKSTTACPIISTPTLSFTMLHAETSGTGSLRASKRDSKSSSEGRTDQLRPMNTGRIDKSINSVRNGHKSRSSFIQKRHDVKEVPEMQYVCEMQALRTRSETAESTIAYLEEELRGLKVHAQNDHATIEELRDKLQIKELELVDYRDKRNVDHANLSTLRDSLRASAATLSEQHHDCATFRERMRGYDVIVQELSSEVASFRTHAAEAMRDIDAKRNEVKSLLDVLHEVQLAYEKESLRSQSLQGACDRQAGIMSEDRDRITDLSRQLSELLSLHSALQEQFQSEISSKDKHIQELQTVVNRLRHEDEENEQVALRQVQTSLTNLYGTILKDKESLLQEKTDLLTRLSQCEHDLREATSKLEINKRAKDSLVIECQENQASMDAAKAELLNAENEIYKYIDELAKSRHEVAHLKEAHNAELLRVREEEQTVAREELLQLESINQALKDGAVEQAGLISELQHKIRQGELDLLGSSSLNEERLNLLRQSLRDDYDAQLKTNETRLLQLKDQEHMQLENQIKAQSSKITRLEQELYRVQLASKSEPSGMLSPTSLVSDAAPQHDVTTHNATHEPATTCPLTRRTEPEQQQIAKVKSVAGSTRRLQVAATQCESHETSAALKEDKETSFYFASINQSSQSFDVDDPTDLDFINDTPPRVSSTIARARKSSGQGKRRRSLQVDIVRHTQEEANDTALGVITPARLNQCKEPKPSRGRGTTRSSNKKRKSN